jgi:hypothetical protein
LLQLEDVMMRAVALLAWLFDGAGPVFLATIGGWWRARRKRTAIIEVSNASPYALRERIYSDQVFECGSPRPETIVEDVHQAPPLQRSQKATHYVGIPVEWSGQLMSVWPSAVRGGWLRVRLASSMSDALAMAYLDFEVPAAPGWSLAHEGTVFKVWGIIADVVDYTVYLHKVRLSSRVLNGGTDETPSGTTTSTRKRLSASGSGPVRCTASGHANAREQEA